MRVLLAVATRDIGKSMISVIHLYAALKKHLLLIRVAENFGNLTLFALRPKNIHYCGDTGLDKMLAYRILTFKKESWYNRGKEKKK